ncbi:hypothetical protein PO883_27890, partial [Massilia sp. DJPM01]|uniref:hypothetical protein n=1 Tax=Massilia sp. DJPM01 TaxID=3024404 RepID=UPI00259FC413
SFKVSQFGRIEAASSVTRLPERGVKRDIRGGASAGKRGLMLLIALVFATFVHDILPLFLMQKCNFCYRR